MRFGHHIQCEVIAISTNLNTATIAVEDTIFAFSTASILRLVFEGECYWDGGLITNTLLQWVVD